MKYFEKKHHSTILYHLQKFKDEINQPFMEEIKPIYEKLLNNLILKTNLSPFKPLFFSKWIKIPQKER